jgi:hypothetical protein
VGARLKIQKIKIYVVFFINVTNNTTLHLMQKTNFKTIKQNSFSKVIEEDVFYWKAKKLMKRVGNLLEQIISIENLNEAVDAFFRHKE